MRPAVLSGTSRAAPTRGAPLRFARPSSRLAFTLIELLVVVAIIALLLAILFPALRNAREQGKQTVCLANQKTLAAAFYQYASENRDAVVSSWNDRQSWVDWPLRPNGTRMSENELRNQRDTEGEKRGIRAGLLFPYTLHVEVYHCPSDRRDQGPRPEVGFLAYRTYSMPNCMNGDAGWETYVGGTKVSTRITQIPQPARAYAFLEEADPRGVNMNSWVMWLSAEQWIDPLTVWHLDKSTIGYADGHAEVHAWQDSRTIYMSREQIFNTDATDNRDWEFLQARWAVR